jgi:hypothetical protein
VCIGYRSRSPDVGNMSVTTFYDPLTPPLISLGLIANTTLAGRTASQLEFATRVI